MKLMGKYAGEEDLENVNALGKYVRWIRDDPLRAFCILISTYMNDT